MYKSLRIPLVAAGGPSVGPSLLEVNQKEGR